MNFLITGGAGFIGSHLAQLCHRTHRVRVLDDFSSGSRCNLNGLDAEVIEGSITDRPAVRAALREVDCVFHLAALVSVPESVEHPDDCVERNITGLLNVLEEAAAAGVRRLVFSSSAAVYGENPASPKHEDLVPDPRSPYAVTKLAGEHFCRLFALSRRLETVSLRYFNVFGPRQNPDSAYAAAVPVFIRQALAGEALTIYGDGLQTRDFIHVRDVAAANLFAATQPGLTGVFNVGCGEETTILGLARRILAATGSTSVIRHAPARAGDVRHSRAAVELIRRAGFRPSVDLDAGLADAIAAIRSTAATSAPVS